MNSYTPNLPVSVGPPAASYQPEPALKRDVRIGMLLVGTLIALLLSLAFLVNIAGAVITTGNVAVETQVKKIAHPVGGVIAEVYVRDGQRVRAGDRLMRLDSAVSGVSANVSSEGVIRLLAQRARLEAERDRRGIVFPPELTSNVNPLAQAIMADEQRLFEIRTRARAQTQAQLRERIQQLSQQIQSFQAQINANGRQLALIQPELEGMRDLWERRLITMSRLNQLERSAVELEGRSAALTANIAQARAQITETSERSVQVDQDARGEAGQQLTEVVAQLAEQQVRRASAGDTYERSLITSPANGIIDKLAFTTIGGVVPPAQTIMEVVPDEDRMTVRVQVSPGDVDQLRVGQPAVLLFSAFNLQTTPEIRGTLEHVSADVETDERSGGQFYRARIGVSDAELRRLGGLQLVPGMPVEAHIQTTSRSLLSYILKPLRDQLNRAFREG